MTRSALVVAPAWVGDTILAQPMLQLIRCAEPDLSIDVLAPPWTAGLAARLPGVRDVIEAPFRHGQLGLGARRAVARTVRARGYAKAWVLPNSFKSALVPWFADIPERIGYVGEWRHWLLTDARLLDEVRLPTMAERFAALALGAGTALPPVPPPVLDIDDASRTAVLARLGLHTARPVAALCPGAEYGPAKRWPPSQFASLADRLVADGFQVWLFGSSKDQSITAEIRSMCSARSQDLPTDLAGRTSLAEAIDLMSLAALVVSNDSGLMHVSAALDLPTVALYGSSSPGFTPPLSPRAEVVSLGLPCSPCFARECPLGHFHCMRQLTPERVLDTIGRMRASSLTPIRP
ncbi:MAG: lipopolysaccharide heptosyltransferase II [Rhodocyclaceae bacterium]|nr:lipopolysaccharide heptosyltransferase II [Rhodocyclaceae bacterium]MCA3074369.1 lipopolysaccharide heptosyltransferase II [Rhodocyclaceae bacterium]MCA3090776.1 lipopolysaccharide heptosyltransferase II [Rhodocyclaceae bacterium]MCA3095545.1 lipopolysaccharide heptosyltransferase II [Rhodocyclaceae bacterium]MCA3097552.1 lipopolysaccharide heptosyltransferase II [Rhodocyclaceae bacterium]